ncbi:MAG: hypothetical protein LWW95_09205 [Candidatus Desulfofervidus auxilii]|nr:hypothetical protein [Candidatus Desulfofervidus auxilii]
MILFDKIPLKNGLTLELWDASKEEIRGLWTVKVIARCKIEIKKEYFEEFSSGSEWYKQLIKIKGNYVIYEQQKKKSLVIFSEKERVFKILVERLKKHIFPYVSNQLFPKNVILKTLSELVKTNSTYFS